MRFILFALVLLTVYPAMAQDGTGTAVAERFARPALSDLASAAAMVEHQATGLCAEPSAEKLDALRGGFSELAAAFGRVSVLRFGPLAAENRFERLFFWPDPRGIALRQVQGALADRDETFTERAALPGKSAALQGLPAFEFVLFGSGAETLQTAEGAYRCRVAEALSQNVAALAGTVSEGWGRGAEFAASLEGPAPDHKLYRTVQEVDAELVKALSTPLQFIRAAELKPPFGTVAEKANGRLSPFWRSGATFPFVAAQVQGIRDLLAASGFRARLADDQSFIVDSLDFELATAARQLGLVDQPAETAFRDEAMRGHIGVALLALEHADELVSDKLAAGLGLTMGFNALDGD